VSAAEVEAALREVLGSALGPSARAYAAASGRPAGEPPVAVLIHRYVAGELAGGAAVDPALPALPSPPGSLLIDARGAPVPDPVRATLQAALHALADRYGAVEIEWVAGGGQVTFLQLRPYRAAPRVRPWAGLAELGEDGWQWDAAHNPLPLSAAQAGLVALVDGRCRIGFRQRVVRGYLFWAPGGALPRPALVPSEIASATFTMMAAAESALAALGDPPPLEEALDVFCSVYERIYGLLRPALQRARTQLTELLSAHLPEGLPSLPALLTGVPSRASERRARAERILCARDEAERRAALADYLALFGDESTIWDVSAPTHREQPDLLLQRLGTRPATLATENGPPAASPPVFTADQIRARLPASELSLFAQRLTEARAAVAAGEDDDWIYARLQAAIRRALLAIGADLQAAGALDRLDDVFHLPLDRVRAHVAGQPLPDARALARAGAAAHADALRDPPPLTGALSSGPLRGAGTGGRAVGRVHWHDPFRPPPADAVLVAATLLPTELPLLQVAALITETGGALDHVATQARERGLPAIVGAAGARARLPEGTLVLVDADTGLAVPLPVD
jgi:phosphohistidine swiveling domain-containing protein